MFFIGEKKKYYVGFWNDGKQKGLGKFIKADNIKYGVWKDGKKEKWFNDQKEFFDKFDKSDEKYKSFFNWDVNHINKFFDIDIKNVKKDE